MPNWTEDDHMTPEQEKAAWEEERGLSVDDLDDCRCWRCKNPIPRRVFVKPEWERCDRCAAEESNEHDMQALRRTVARKERRW